MLQSPSSLSAESFEVTAVGVAVAAWSLARCVMSLDGGTQQSRLVGQGQGVCWLERQTLFFTPVFR